MKRNNNKGFTLAELLIVVAVIAVLVAVAIPTFAGQLEKSRQAVDVSNLRGAYAAARLAEIDQAVGNLTFKQIIAGATTAYPGGLQYWYDPDSGNLTRVSDDEADASAIGKATTSKVVADTSQLPSVGKQIIYKNATLTNDSVGTVDKGILVTFTSNSDTNGRYVLDKITFVENAGEWNWTSNVAKKISGFIDVVAEVTSANGISVESSSSAVTSSAFAIANATADTVIDTDTSVSPYKFESVTIPSDSSSVVTASAIAADGQSFTVTVAANAEAQTVKLSVVVTDKNENMCTVTVPVVITTT